MSRLNLRAAFALGLDATVAAQQVFTDRVTEVSAFDAALGNLAASLKATELSPVLDRAAPRKNLLSYFGVGGIGKTTLSRELQARYTTSYVATHKQRPAAVRCDFADPSAFDQESFVLRLRATLSVLAPQFPAFDLALSVYWERAHPGERLQEFVANNSTLRNLTEADGLADQIAASVTESLSVVLSGVVADALPGVVGASRTLGSVYGRARQAIASHQVLRTCELLPDLLEAEADLDTLSYFPYLLAWDLERLRKPRPAAVVFLDTFEAVSAQQDRQTERVLQRCVFLMPNVLFVITGRNRLDWADSSQAGELDFVGAERWPYLHAGHVGEDPRQHLVGYLSPEDAHGYLRTALTRDDQPAIPETIRERIVQASSGLPLYLDLAVTRYLDLLAQGRTPDDEDFGRPLPAVIVQILRDLDREERDLLRAAALLEAFDLDMLRSAVPHVADSSLLRFRGRPFLEVDTSQPRRYALHKLLRDTIREADVGLRDSWSMRERAAAAARIGDHLEGVASAAAAAGDRSTEAAAFRQAVLLCVLSDQFFAWMVDAAQRLLTSGGWGLTPDEPNVRNDAVSALLTGLQGARERRSGRLEAAIALMDSALDRPDLPPELPPFLRLHRAHALRVAGRYSDGAADYVRIEQARNQFSAEATYWLADYSFLDGRFDDAQAALSQLSGVSAQLRGEMLRLWGHVYRVNARFDRAEAYYREALGLAREIHSPAAEGKALTDVLQAQAWHQPDAALRVRQAATEVNDSLRNRVELVKIHAASAVAMTLLGQFDEAEVEIDRGLRLTEQCGYPGGMIWCWVARTLHRRRQDDHGGAVAAAARVGEIAGRLGGNRFWGEIATWWVTPDRTGGEPGPTRWIDGADQARARWQAVR